MKDSEDNIKKEVIDKSELPTDSNHPGEEISDENKIILGDQVAGEEPSPIPTPPGKKNYVLIILVIIVGIIAIFWGIKGCHNKSVQSTEPLSYLMTTEIAITHPQ
ncbi:MAG: hypothetical protein ACRCSQ_08550 [Bacteroidales bacterium]